ncbi:MAG: hypothetical protein JXR97_15735 [Planctomycetes bacterium]|nr:hypothetical protein [Planctomycetota bacterium]
MSIIASELWGLARVVETSLAALYHDMATELKPGSEASTFFTRMSTQEQSHAAWVDEMEELTDNDFVFDSIDREDFDTILATISDIHDEVVHKEINLPDALEIILHLEHSTADNFYMKFPEDVPGLPRKIVERMIKSCVQHAKSVAVFKATFD